MNLNFRSALSHSLTTVTHSKSKTFLAVCLAIIIGTASGAVIPIRIEMVIFYLIALGFLLGIIIFSGAKRFVFILLTAFVIGFANYTLAMPSVNIEDGARHIVGTVIAEPDIRVDGVRYILETDDIGRVYMSAPLHPQYTYGDRLAVNCTIRHPGTIGSFRFDMYLAVKRVALTCSNPDISIIGSGGGNFFYRNIFTFKRTIAERVSGVWHEPYAGFVAGLLYGYRGGLGSLDDDFSRTGLTHIVAISGYNIAIVATVIMSMMVRFFLRRQDAFYIVVAGVVVFVIFTGAGASVVRAGIMGILVLLATQMGRVSTAAHLVIVAGTLMVLHNPFVLLWDPGFQLSFVATLGIIYLSVPLSRVFGFLRLHGLIDIVATTSAAILATTPISLYYFESFSLVAPLANVLVLPIIPTIMVTSFATVLVSMVSVHMAIWLGLIPLSLMWVVVGIVRALSALPFASTHVSLSFPLVLVYYLLIIILTRRFVDKKIIF